MLKQKTTILYLTLWLLFFTIATGSYLFFSKSEIQVFFNIFHHHSLDIFFKHITHLGDGISVSIICIIILFISIQKGLTAITACATSALITQILKRIVFASIVRPFLYFDNPNDLLWVEGVKILKHYSFPSGHSAAAFAIFTTIIFFSNKKWQVIVIFFLAFITAFSRVYLNVHFLIDIAVGSLIGVIAALIAQQIWQKEKFNKLNKPLF
jgi:membrane-associated phospholipid phosphatase